MPEIREKIYYYRQRKIIIKLQKDKGAKAHVFEENSEDKVEFTIRYEWINGGSKALIDKVKKKLDRNLEPKGVT